MKFLRALFAILSLGIISIIIIVLTLTSNITPKTEAQTVFTEPNIINEGERKVIADNDSTTQTVSATIISKTPDGKSYSAVNNYDSKDIFVIESQESYEVGTKVNVTFYKEKIQKVQVVKKPTF